MRSKSLALVGALMVSWVTAFAQPMPSFGTGVPELQPESAAPLTLDHALKLVQGANHSLSSARHAARSSEGVVLQAETRPNPTLDIEVEDTSRKGTRTTTTTLSLPIELGGKREARIAAAKLTRDIANQELEQVRSDVRSQAVAAFFDVLIAQEKRALSVKTVEIARSAYRIADKRVQAGKVPPLEVDKARVELANAELESVEATSGLQAARRSLSALWGNPSPRFTEAAGKIGIPPSRPDLSDLDAALEHSPYLQAARLAAERSRALVDVERSKRYPNIDVRAGVARDNDLGRNKVLVGVSIPLPLFDRNQGNVYEASMLAYKSRDDYLGLKTRLHVQLQKAASEFDMAKSTGQQLESDVLPHANTAFERARKGFEAGKFGFLEVLDAQRTLFQARARHLAALSDAYQALAQIHRLLGQDAP